MLLRLKVDTALSNKLRQIIHMILLNLVLGSDVRKKPASFAPSWTMPSPQSQRQPALWLSKTPRTLVGGES